MFNAFIGREPLWPNEALEVLGRSLRWDWLGLLMKTMFRELVTFADSSLSADRSWFISCWSINPTAKLFCNWFNFLWVLKPYLVFKLCLFRRSLFIDFSRSLKEALLGLCTNLLSTKSMFKFENCSSSISTDEKAYWTWYCMISLSNPRWVVVFWARPPDEPIG